MDESAFPLSFVDDCRKSIRGVDFARGSQRAMNNQLLLSVQQFWIVDAA
jgi:hypothetical protein